MRESKRDKGVIDNLTIEVKGVALNKCMDPEWLDHYIDNIPYMVHDKQLDVNFLYFSHLIFCFHHF